MMTKHILLLTTVAAVGILTGCDTTEEGFRPGDKSEIKLGVSATTLEFAASAGSTATLGITGNSKWTIDCDDSHFKFSKKSGEGATDVTVETTSRNPDKTYTISFNVIAEDAEGLNLNQQVTLTQEAIQISDKLTPVFTSYPEEGAEQEIEVKCTVGWIFNTDGTAASKAGFRVDPQSGDGRARAFKVKLIYDPNYTEEERSVSVTFDPSSSADLTTLQDNLPPAITLTQAAGTRPKELKMELGTPTYTDCQVTLKFESKAPIEECGVTLTGGGLDGEVFRATLASPDDHVVTWTLEGLKEGALYSVTPFVVSKVGRTEGNSEQLRMDARAREPEITDVSYDIQTRMVTANVTFDSGMEVTNVGLEVYNDIYVDSPLVSYTSAPFSMMTGTQSISTTDFMSPNTEYEVRPFILYKDSAGVEKRLDHDRVKIRTKSLTPSEGDNEPIQ